MSDIQPQIPVELMQPILETSGAVSLPALNNTPTVDTINQVEQIGRLRRALSVGRRAVETAVAVTLISPANEAIRVAAVGAAGIASHNPVAIGLTAGLSTLGVETVSGLTMADLLREGDMGKMSKGINAIMDKTHLKKDTKLKPVTEATVSYFTGSGVATYLKHSADPTRTRGQNMKYALKNAAALGGVLGAQGFLISEGVLDFRDPIKDISALGGIALLVGSNIWFRRQSDKANKLEKDIEAVQKEQKNT